MPENKENSVTKVVEEKGQGDVKIFKRELVLHGFVPTLPHITSPINNTFLDPLKIRRGRAGLNTER